MAPTKRTKSPQPSTTNPAADATVAAVNRATPPKSDAPRVGGANIWMRHEDWMELALVTFRASALESDPIRKRQLRRLADRLTESAGAGIVSTEGK